MTHDGFSPRTVRIRPRAIADIENHANYLEEHAPPDVTLRFRSAIVSAVEQIAVLPNAGALRPVKNPRLAGLRMWSIPDFRNYLIFYITPDGDIEIVRVFHGAQDIASLIEDEPDDA